ncbi:MAG TPA: phosphatase PAP2 family protein [Candidatus Pseudogracilibacillus intestinigallinarum]|uniref:Phosphatase PAP2 family protein n=1 Tax=Candidatus Pseudogracilibacillus intestinigallinarum TaxID=2838742 RepID=A0A9D1PNG9_9BACI|nr:phosphatase PAP2 family protein [Candidatus Pseudogracilibacillus intestinigallinarum]
MNTKSKIPLIGAGVFLFLFIVVALLTTGTQGFLLDENVAYWADQQTNAVFLKLMEIASVLGSSEMILLITVIIGIVFIVKGNWRHFFFFFVLSVGGVLVNLGLKMLVRRARPGDEISYIEVFDFNFELQSYSFPSGHTMRATILLLFLMYVAFYFGKRMYMQIIAYAIYAILIVFVALSRVILEAHFFTDILGAIIISFAWFLLCFYLFYKPKRASYSLFS